MCAVEKTCRGEVQYPALRGGAGSGSDQADSEQAGSCASGERKGTFDGTTGSVHDSSVVSRSMDFLRGSREPGRNSHTACGGAGSIAGGWRPPDIVAPWTQGMKASTT